MKKGKNIVYFGMFFLAAFLSEVYCLLQFREDVITVVGVGIVLLIAAYLWMDTIRSDYFKEVEKKEKLQNNLEQNSKNEKSDDLEKIEAKLLDMEKLQKALYVAVRKSIAVSEESLIQMKLGYEKEMDYSTLVKLLTSEQKQIMKVMAKYNREDTKFIIAGTKTETSKLIQGLKELEKKMEEQMNLQLSEQISIGNSLIQGLQNIHIEIPVTKENELKKSEEEIEKPFVLEEIQNESSNEAFEVIQEGPQEEIVNELPEEIQEENQEEILNELWEGIQQVDQEETLNEWSEEIQEEDQEKTLNEWSEEIQEEDQEEILNGLWEGIQEENQIETDVKSQDELVEIEEKQTEESEEEKKKDVNIDAILSDDPNKALSAEDIAALFASLG